MFPVVEKALQAIAKGMEDPDSGIESFPTLLMYVKKRMTPDEYRQFGEFSLDELLAAITIKDLIKVAQWVEDSK